LLDKSYKKKNTRNSIITVCLNYFKRIIFQ
jgi:hypothetical protein